MIEWDSQFFVDTMSAQIVRWKKAIDENNRGVAVISIYGMLSVLEDVIKNTNIENEFDFSNILDNIRSAQNYTLNVFDRICDEMAQEEEGYDDE
jgi:hypothetical protein